MNTLPYSGFDGFMFNVIPIIVVIGFIVVFGIIIVSAVQGIGQWKKNNDSPVLTVDATIIAKRTNVSRSTHNTGTDSMHHTSTSTTYYVTFEVQSGDRLEFMVQSTEYGMLAEHDTGKLTFQGTRFLKFERNRG